MANVASLFPASAITFDRTLLTEVTGEARISFIPVKRNLRPETYAAFPDHDFMVHANAVIATFDQLLPPMVTMAPPHAVCAAPSCNSSDTIFCHRDYQGSARSYCSKACAMADKAAHTAHCSRLRQLYICYEWDEHSVGRIADQYRVLTHSILTPDPDL